MSTPDKDIQECKDRATAYLLTKQLADDAATLNARTRIADIRALVGDNTAIKGFFDKAQDANADLSQALRNAQERCLRAVDANYRQAKRRAAANDAEEAQVAELEAWLQDPKRGFRIEGGTVVI